MKKLDDLLDSLIHSPLEFNGRAWCGRLQKQKKNTIKLEKFIKWDY
jgi:hypothetical protein